MKGGVKMISKIMKRAQVRGEGGFTLIELLVVIIIIAILAAIAIPMYLSQRQKGWRANVQSDLRNAAVAEESYFTDNSSYAAAVVDLENQGYNNSGSITMLAPVAGDTGDLATSYCLEASHDSDPGGTQMHFLSSEGNPADGACPAAGP